MATHFEGKKPDFDPGEEFIKSGGEILEFHPDGRPARWKCGKGKDGAAIHPKGIAKETVSYINDKGEFEGRIPDPDKDREFLEEMRLWRSDLINPSEDQKKD